MEMEMDRNVGRESERSDRPVKIDGFDLAAGKHGCELRIFFFFFCSESERDMKNESKEIIWIDR